MNSSKTTLLLVGWTILFCSSTRTSAQEWQPVVFETEAEATRPAAPAPKTEPELLAQPAAQPDPAPAPRKADALAWYPDVLRQIPRTPDQPRSLLEPAAAMYPVPSATPAPYFESDPLLDPPNLPHPGWFGSFSTQAAGVHIYRNLVQPVTVGGRPTDIVDLPNRGLNWTVVPSGEIGYNLPAGFGGFAISYRLMGTSGNYALNSGAGVGALHSRADLNMADIVYITPEMINNPLWTMKWRFGARIANVYFDSTLTEAPAAVPAAGGILQEHASNHFLGVGTHVGLELGRQLPMAGLSVQSQLQFSSIWGSISQGVSALALDATSPTGVSFGNVSVTSSQTAPVAMLSLGLDYQPPQFPGLHCFAGYQYENWWNVGRFSLQPRSRGDLSFQGIILSLGYNY